MLRTPLKTALFFLLIIFSVALFIIGLTILINASTNLKRTSEAFVTIGTVQQKENTMLTEAIWDAGLRKHIYTNSPVYDSYIPIEALQMDGIEYISGPEQRPYYGGYVPDLIVTKVEKLYVGPVIEFTPIEMGIPSEPIDVEVVNVLYGEDLHGQKIKFCDHFTENPQLLEVGKTYIAFVIPNFTNTAEHKNLSKTDMEYTPHKIYADQLNTWDEVGKEFYQTIQGKRWLNYVEGQKRFYEKTVPVTPTQDTNLLSAFHNGEAVIIDGRDINNEEYNSGAKVCLISQKFAELNNIIIGDTVELQLYSANYNSTAIQIIGYNSYTLDEAPFLKRDGEKYDIFETNNYTVVGVYSHPDVFGVLTGYELSPNEVIVPVNSISNSDENNIVLMGPMQGKNTSFRIKNGEIEKFMEIFSQTSESGLLEIQFYDNGYEQFAGNLENLKYTGLILFFIGFALMIAVICLLLYFYITKQQKRTAIERSLGMTKRECIISLSTGIVILTGLGTVVGCIFGMLTSSSVEKQILSDVNFFSLSYSKGVQHYINTDIDFVWKNNNSTFNIIALTVVGTILIVYLASIKLINDNLKVAPIHTLNSKSSD